MFSLSSSARVPFPPTGHTRTCLIDSYTSFSVGTMSASFFPPVHSVRFKPFLRAVPFPKNKSRFLLLPLYFYFLSSLTLTHTRTHTALPTLIQSILRTCIKEPSFFSFQVSCFRFFLILEHISRRCRTHTHTPSLSLPRTHRAMHACMLQARPFFIRTHFPFRSSFCELFFSLLFRPARRQCSLSLHPSLPHARTFTCTTALKAAGPLLRTHFLFRPFFLLFVLSFYRPHPKKHFTHPLTHHNTHTSTLSPSLLPSPPSSLTHTPHPLQGLTG